MLRLSRIIAALVALQAVPDAIVPVTHAENRMRMGPVRLEFPDDDPGSDPNTTVNQNTAALASIHAGPVTGALPSPKHAPSPEQTLDATTNHAVETTERPCVLISNGNVIFGTAVQRGEQVVVRRGENTEIRLPRSEVLCWADRLVDLYQFRVDHRTVGTLRNHLEDARWCLRHGLPDQAAAELDDAERIDPTSAQVNTVRKQLDRVLNARDEKHQSVKNDTRQVSANRPTTGRPESVQAKAASLRSGKPIIQASPANESTPPPTLDLGTLRYFVSKIQPVLLNRCGSCHAQSSNRSWSLVKPPIGTRSSPRITRENLAATIRFVDRSSPDNSELLRFALEAHGDMTEAPLGPRNSLAVAALKDWCRSLQESDAESTNALTLAPSQDQSSSTREMPPDVGATSAEAMNTPHLGATRDETAWSQRDNSEVQPSLPASGGGIHRLPEVSNPFDPDIFNRRFHATVKAAAESPAGS